MSDAAPAPPPRRTRWYQRLQAWLLAKEHPAYIQAVEPYKRDLFGALSGVVVEIGPGAGVNLAYLRPDARWVGVEPNPFLHDRIAEKAEALGRDIEIIGGLAGALPFESGSVDAVISSLVLCSVPDVPAAVAEIMRVLRPGGRYAFVEHVADPHGGRRAAVQRTIQPLWSAVADGCHPDRRTWESIERAGFSDVRLEFFTAPVPIVGPHIAGTAVR